MRIDNILDLKKYMTDINYWGRGISGDFDVDSAWRKLKPHLSDPLGEWEGYIAEAAKIAFESADLYSAFLTLINLFEGSFITRDSRTGYKSWNSDGRNVQTAVLSKISNAFNILENGNVIRFDFNDKEIIIDKYSFDDFIEKLNEAKKIVENIVTLTPKQKAKIIADIDDIIDNCGSFEEAQSKGYWVRIQNVMGALSKLTPLLTFAAAIISLT